MSVANPAQDDEDDAKFRETWEKLLHTVSLETATKRWGWTAGMCEVWWGLRRQRLALAADMNSRYKFAGTGLDIFRGDPDLAMSLKAQYHKMFSIELGDTANFASMTTKQAQDEYNAVRYGGNVHQESGYLASLQQMNAFWATPKGQQRMQELLAEYARRPQEEAAQKQREQQFNGKPYLGSGR